MPNDELVRDVNREEATVDDRSKSRVTLEPEPAAAVAEIFHLYAHDGLSLKAIANHLNRAGGPPSPKHLDPTRNVRGHWAASTVRSILATPSTAGTRLNRPDFASARQNGGGGRRRAKEEWTVAEDTHLPLVSAATYEAAQDRLASRQCGPTERSRSTYLFAGRVRCCTGHQPLSMQGKARKRHHYYACRYGETYGDDAAVETHAARNGSTCARTTSSSSLNGSSPSGSSGRCASRGSASNSVTTDAARNATARRQPRTPDSISPTPTTG